MRDRKCQMCGNLFAPVTGYEVYCPVCSPKARAATVIRTRTCRQCGASFEGGPGAWYCPNCRLERRRESDRKSKQNGTQRPLGSIDHCEICGKEYVVRSGRQRYCKDCADEAVAAKTRPVKRAYNAAHRERLKALDKAQRRAAATCVVCGNPIPVSRHQAMTCDNSGCQRLYAQYSQTLADLARGDTRNIEPAGGIRIPFEDIKFARIWALKAPDGMVYQTDNLAGFLREHPDWFPARMSAQQGLSFSAASDGKHLHRGWAARRQNPTCQILAPDGTVHTVEGTVRDFVYSHPEIFDRPASALVTLYPQRTCEGWTLLAPKQQHGRVRTAKKHGPHSSNRHWVLADPSGKEWETNNLAEFTRGRPDDFPNPLSALQQLSGRGSCKGWVVVSKTIVDHDADKSDDNNNLPSE